jgi:DNA polymerase-3 subunit epsilon
MSRSVLFDTETTGIDPLLGHRVIEIAAVELRNELPTGRHFHALIDPERDVPADATRIHGICTSDLRGKPRFAEIADALLEFLGEDDPLVAHNATFDFAFLDHELRLAGRPPLDPSRMVDTLALARARFPGLPNSLDSLCRRYEIDLSERTTHNALLDCRLLAQVYLELVGGRQGGLDLVADAASGAGSSADLIVIRTRTPRPIVPSAEALAAHAAFIATLKDPVWLTT